MPLTTYLLAFVATMASLAALGIPGHGMAGTGLTMWAAFVYVAHEDLADYLTAAQASAVLAPVAAASIAWFTWLDGMGSLLAGVLAMTSVLGLAHFKARGFQAALAPARR